MHSSINLVTPKKKDQQPVQRLLVISIVVFSGVFLLAVSLLGYFLYVRSQITELVAQEEVINKQINDNSQAKLNALILKDRLTNISRILNTRNDINKQVDIILSVIPDQLQIQSFEIKDTDVVLTLESNDLGLFNTFLEQDISGLDALTDIKVKTSNIESFRVTTVDPRYSMNLNFELSP